MRIEKRGKIFDPTAISLAEGCVAYAQSPQTLLIEAGVRIYFSTRSVDAEGGKFRSRIAFVEMDPTLRHILRVSDRPVIALGDLGCFDEHGIFPMNVIRNGTEVWGYTCGWNRRVSVSVDTAIGLAISHDGGITFQKHGAGPILGPSLNEPFLVGDGFVVQAEGRFHIWYIFGTRWLRETEQAAPDRVYKIGHAISADGVFWTGQGGAQVVSDVLGRDECQALPSVAYFAGAWHMVFCYRDIHGFRTDPKRGYRIGYARSDDLVRWDRDDAALGLTGTLGEWDSDMQCYPHLFVLNGELLLLYNGNHFGREGFGVARISP